MNINEDGVGAIKWLTVTASFQPGDKTLLDAVVADVSERDGNTTTSAVLRRLVRQEAVRRGLTLTNAAAYEIADADTDAFLRNAR
jgi:hypothetical protein